MLIQRGKISAYEGEKARVTITEDDDFVTAPLTIGHGALWYEYTVVRSNQYVPEYVEKIVANRPKPGENVAILLFDDGEGVVLANLDAPADRWIYR